MLILIFKLESLENITKLSLTVRSLVKLTFVNHPSIKTIKQNFNITSKFSFQPVSVNDVKQVIKDLKSNRSVGGDIPTNILKECNFTFSVLADCINTSFENGAFPDCLKEANVTPIFKKDDPLDKENYRPVVYFHCSLRFLKN